MNNGTYQSNLHKYNRSKYNVESPAKIILTLYETALACLRKSLIDIDNKKIESAHKNITKAKQIISELTYSLNTEDTGDFSRKLRMLYDYIYIKLLDANIKKDKSSILDCIALLKNVYEGWQIGTKEIKESSRTENKQTKNLNFSI